MENWLVFFILSMSPFTDCLEFGELSLDMEGAFAHIKAPRKQKIIRLISKRREHHADKQTAISSKVFIFPIDCML
jgi:hypothetical protein